MPPKAETPTSPQAPPPTRLLAIKVSQAREGDAIVRVKWNLHPGALEELRTRNILHPHILILVYEKTRYADGNRLWNTNRYLSALEDGFAQIELNKPGDFEVKVVLVGNKIPRRHNSWKSLRQLRERKNHWTYHEIQFDEQGLALGQDTLIGPAESIEITVKEENFAKQPPPGLWWWVNLWYDQKACDQCQFRRRMFFSFTIKPALLAFLIPLTILIRLLGVLILIGAARRDINFLAIVRPFENDIPEIAKSSWEDREAYWNRTDRGGNTRSKWFLAAFLPFPLTFICLLTISIGVTYKANEFALQGAILCLLTVLTGPVLLLISIGIENAKRRPLKTKETTIPKEIDPVVYGRQFAHLMGSVNTATPPDKPSKTPIEPTSPRSRIVITYLDLKAKVCRPFAPR